ncbi:hypothetical protein ACFRDV_42885 [Streptomyces fagopyri]|uniref:hypothetical protein n=1 Tax=Streptomyces fagopyri TaxID=2662397 RepID=UPI0036CB2202
MTCASEAFRAATDHDGDTVPGSAAVCPWSDPRALVQANVHLDHSDRPFAWFAYFLQEAGTSSSTNARA